MNQSGFDQLEAAVARLPWVLAEAMRAGMEEPGVRIGAGAYETELAMCPVAAAVRYAERSGGTSGDWDPAWGTRDEFRFRVLDFVDAFDACTERLGLTPTLAVLRRTLAPVLIPTDLWSSEDDS